MGTLSPYTVASRVRSLKRLFKWLQEEGEIDENPADRIRTPSPRRRKPKAISKQDFLALYKSTGDDEISISAKWRGRKRARRLWLPICRCGTMEAR